MFTAVFRTSGRWCAGYVEEIPGVKTQGATLEGSRENLREALSMVIDANREFARREASANCIRESIPLPA